MNATTLEDPTALRGLMEHYKDLAFPTASLVFAILGIPLGIVSKRSGRVGGFAVGVMVVIVYYVLNVLSEFFVTTRVFHPFIGAWLPNLLFVAVTLILFHHVNRR
jgi:lipopolysaccharide export system permease protein